MVFSTSAEYRSHRASGAGIPIAAAGGEGGVRNSQSVSQSACQACVTSVILPDPPEHPAHARRRSAERVGGGSGKVHRPAAQGQGFLHVLRIAPQVRITPTSRPCHHA